MNPQRVFLAGIGGMGMAPLALYLKGEGFCVEGCDDRLSPPVRTLLEGAGVPCASFAALPEDCDTLVYSSAVAPTHPLRRAAAERGLPQFRRGEFLARRLEGKSLVAVVGSHGKTTTTAMLVHLLSRAGFPFSYLVGGLFNDSKIPPARYAPGARCTVAEIDESDGTIELFSPGITVALNFDWDHPDRYRDEAALEKMFFDLFRRTRGDVIVPENSARLREIAARAGKNALTFPVSENFNETNAAAALAAAAVILPSPPTRADLEGFCGVRRRQDCLLERQGLKVVADYAHHPTEVAAFLRALRRKHASARLCAVFQPHRYSRTRQYAGAFAAALAQADNVFLLPVYSAGEPFDDKGTTAAIRARWDSGVPVRELAPEEVCGALLGALCADAAETVIAFIGAGDIDETARACARVLSDSFAQRLFGKLSPKTLLRANEPLAAKTTFRIGGAAKWYAEPADIGDLRALTDAARAEGKPVFVLGRGSNLLVPDDGFDGLVVRLSAPEFSQIEREGAARIRAGAGARLKTLCARAAAAGLSGLEGLEGIPASVGGALRMNAGAMGDSAFDCVVSLDILDASGEVRTLLREQLSPRYRTCPELEGAIALSALFEMKPDTPEAVRARMASYAEKRAAAQPKAPSAGCVFQNPEGDSAGRLIDAAGLKGAREGGAIVSQAHANFIVNAGGATCADVVALVRRVRAAVRDRAGKTLSPEIRLLGRDWDSIL